MVLKSGVSRAGVRRSVTSPWLLMVSGQSGQLGPNVVVVVALASRSLNVTATIHSKSLDAHHGTQRHVLDEELTC